jgi:ribosomal protein L25 (general stress protein Ctc)
MQSSSTRRRARSSAAARALRRSGQVPIVLYGPGVAPLNLQVEARHCGAS